MSSSWFLHNQCFEYFSDWFIFIYQPSDSLLCWQWHLFGPHVMRQQAQANATQRINSSFLVLEIMMQTVHSCSRNSWTANYQITIGPLKWGTIHKMAVFPTWNTQYDCKYPKIKAGCLSADIQAHIHRFISNSKCWPTEPNITKMRSLSQYLWTALIIRNIRLYLKLEPFYHTRYLDLEYRVFFGDQCPVWSHQWHHDRSS